MFIMNFQRIIAYKKIYSNTKFLWTGHRFEPTTPSTTRGNNMTGSFKGQRFYETVPRTVSPKFVAP